MKIKHFNTKVKSTDLIKIRTDSGKDIITVIAESKGKEVQLSFELSENIIIEKLQEKE